MYNIVQHAVLCWYAVTVASCLAVHLPPHELDLELGLGALAHALGRDDDADAEHAEAGDAYSCVCHIAYYKLIV